MTLAEFMNAFMGFTEQQESLIKQGWEQSRYVLSGLVSNPKPFPWSEGTESKPYTQQEKEAILESHEQAKKRGGIKQILTAEGWKNVDT